jgi:hypothetical protein
MAIATVVVQAYQSRLLPESLRPGATGALFYEGLPTALRRSAAPADTTIPHPALRSNCVTNVSAHHVSAARRQSSILCCTLTDHGSEATAVKCNVRKQQRAIVRHMSGTVMAIAIPCRHRIDTMQAIFANCSRAARRRLSSGIHVPSRWLSLSVTRLVKRGL